MDFGAVRTPSEPSDGELIAQFVDGRAAAFDALVRRYETTLSGFLRRMVRDHALADDLFQETFLRVMRSLPTYREEGRFGSWLFGIARNLALDALRRRRFEQELFRRPLQNTASDGTDSALIEGVTDSRLAPDALAERAEWGARLEAAIAELPEEQREVLALRYDAGLTFRQIAEITGSSINTALGRMRYATIALRKKLGVVRAEDQADEGPRDSPP